MDRVFIDHYATLQVAPDADEQTIKSAYRRLARTYHPDRPNGNTHRFLEIQSSYSVLMEKERRKEYDVVYDRIVRKKSPSETGTLMIPPGRIRFPGSMANLARRGLLRKSLRNKDRKLYLRIDYDMELPLKETEIRNPILLHIPVPSRKLCPDCKGSDPDCPSCSGKGYRKATSTIRLEFSGGLVFGQILELDLSGTRPGDFAHFKKKKIKLLISRLKAS